MNQTIKVRRVEETIYGNGFQEVEVWWEVEGFDEKISRESQAVQIADKLLEEMKNHGPS